MSTITTSPNYLFIIIGSFKPNYHMIATITTPWDVNELGVDPGVSNPCKPSSPLLKTS
jgi:hypothetical protein